MVSTLSSEKGSPFHIRKTLSRCADCKHWCALVSSCKPLLIATYNPEEGKLREHLLDRFAISISADVNLTMEQRLEAVDIATVFQNKPQQLIDDTSEVTDATKTQVTLAVVDLLNTV